jgi:hypothetical protein
MTMGWVADKTSWWRRADPGGRRPSRKATHWPRTVPAAVLSGAELVHLGGGESLPCPDADHLPLAPAAARAGLGTNRLALPPARVHVLSDVVVRPRCGVVTSGDGRIVAESVTTAMIGRVPLDEDELRRQPIHVDGTVAVFRSPLRSTYHTLVDDLPRAGLLIHPALGRLGNMAVLHDGPLTDMESTLLEHLGGRRIRLQEVEPGQPIHADRVVVPNFVTRPGAGAVPSWFRRWCDQVPLPCAAQGPRRVFLDGGTGSSARNRSDLLEVLERHGIEALDPASLSPAELLAILRDADLVVGSADGGLTGCLFSHRAHVVELLDDVTLEPAMYYLAASKGLPYDYVPAVVPTEARRPVGGRRAGATGEVTVDIGWIDRLLDRVAA